MQDLQPLLFLHTIFRKEVSEMPKNLKREIARLFYEENLTKDELLKEFKVRPKTLQSILGEFKSEFVKES